MAFAADNVWFETAPDGARLRVGHWPAATQTDVRGQVLLLQGRTEFLEKYEETIGELAARGYEVWALDWRGQGLSDRMLANRHKGHTDRFETFLDDLSWFADRIVREPPAGQRLVLAHSMGGHIAMRALLEGRLRPDRAVLSAPMIDLPMTGLKRLGTRALAGAAAAVGAGSCYVPGMGDYDASRIRFENNVFTSDEIRFARVHAAIADNPDIALGGATLGWLDAAFRSIGRLRSSIAGARDICPILVCAAQADTVVSLPAQSELCAALSACTHAPIEGSRHEVLIEKDELRSVFWNRFDAFTGASIA